MESNVNEVQLFNRRLPPTLFCFFAVAATLGKCLTRTYTPLPDKLCRRGFENHTRHLVHRLDHSDTSQPFNTFRDVQRPRHTTIHRHRYHSGQIFPRTETVLALLLLTACTSFSWCWSFRAVSFCLCRPTTCGFPFQHYKLLRA